jgi:hypothetical protein
MEEGHGTPFEELCIRWWKAWDKLQTRKEIASWLNENLEELKEFRREMRKFLKKAEVRAHIDTWRFEKSLAIRMLEQRVHTIVIWRREYRKLEPRLIQNFEIQSEV